MRIAACVSAFDTWDGTPWQGVTIWHRTANGSIVHGKVITDASTTEGNAGVSNLTITVILSAATGNAVSVDFATVAGIATEADDYTSVAGTLTFNPGEKSKTITVPIIGDVIDEFDETFFVNLSNPINAAIAVVQGVGTIKDNDNPPTLSIDDMQVTEGDAGTVEAVFTVSLNQASGKTITVNAATANGGTNPAAAGTDYDFATQTITFAPGETTQAFAVTVRGDTTLELNEQFLVKLSSPTNATIADAQGVGTINNDEPVPTVSVADVADVNPEGNSGTKNAAFVVTLTSIAPMSMSRWRKMPLSYGLLGP